jgi:uncharacterized protein YtpQ (UPF0354 family)
LNVRTLKNKLQKRLEHPERTFHFDSKKDTLRIENTETQKGITISLPPIVAKWEDVGDKAIDEVVYYVEEALSVMGKEQTVNDEEKKIFPVIRSTSFPKEAKEGVSFVYDDHTAETRIYYALDLGSTYRLIDVEWLEKKGWSHEHVRQTALFNVRSLPTPVKKDEVAGNVFYFLNTNDGYDASRILNQSFLKEMERKIKGTMAIAVPHQDVLIFADIQNDQGYDVLAQLTMSFFTNGHVPITALSFLYEEGELEPIFILGKNRKR